jgi:hypothetical protein
VARHDEHHRVTGHNRRGAGDAAGRDGYLAAADAARGGPVTEMKPSPDAGIVRMIFFIGVPRRGAVRSVAGAQPSAR